MVYRGLDDRDQLLRSANELLKYASKAVVAEPGNSSALGRGASALVILGNIAQAKEWIERALLIDPDNLDIRYNFACSLINESADANLIFEYLDYVFARSVGSIVRRADLDADLDPIRDHPHFREIYAAAMERLAKLDAEQAASDASSIAAASAPPRS
jgi:adenylate cyclase